MILEIREGDELLGAVELVDGELTGPEPLVDLVRFRMQRDDVDAAAAMRSLDGESNGYTSTELVAGQDEARSLEDLRTYWTTGKGLARWSTSTTPLRALYDHLAKHMPDKAEARATAIAWFIDAMGRQPVTRDGDLPGGDDDEEKT